MHARLTHLIRMFLDIVNAMASVKMGPVEVVGDEDGGGGGGEESG